MLVGKIIGIETIPGILIEYHDIDVTDGGLIGPVGFGLGSQPYVVQLGGTKVQQHGDGCSVGQVPALHLQLFPRAGRNEQDAYHQEYMMPKLFHQA